jgi:fumarylacetoacetase
MAIADMLQSFIEISAGHPFSIQNLPYGIFSVADRSARVGMAIGDCVLDLKLLEERGLVPPLGVFGESSLNPLMEKGAAVWRQLRDSIQELLDERNPRVRDDRSLREQVLIPIQQVMLHFPVQVGDYTDFYSSKQHASNVGAMFRGKENALLPNWLHLPVAYHGRSSSLVLSGASIRRPYGQVKRADESQPRFEPSREMDFELEVGAFIGTGNRLGEPIPVGTAHEHLFGLVLVNDWSVRDVQRWEYAPLGPFLAKNIGTSVSPWVVTMEALEPFRIKGPTQQPQPLPYLRHGQARSYDINLEVGLQTGSMQSPVTICRTNFRYLYWDMNQQIAHHTITGCNLRTGDLLASGTISGDERESFGSLLELSWGGKNPIELPNGEKRSFLEDGDTVIMTGYAQGDGFRVGFGEVRGTIVAAR